MTDILPAPPAILRQVRTRIGDGWAAAPQVSFYAGNNAGLLQYLGTGQAALDLHCDVLMLPSEEDAQELQRRIPEDVWSKLIGVLGEGMSLLNPIAKLVTAAGEAGWQIIRALRTPASDPSIDPVALLREVLLSAVRRRQTLVVMDAPVSGHVDLLRTLAWVVRHSLDPDTPLQILCLIEGPEALTPAPSAGLEDSLGAWGPACLEARSLVDEGRARWYHLAPLGRGAVREWMGPVDGDLAPLSVSTVARRRAARREACGGFSSPGDENAPRFGIPTLVSTPPGQGVITASGRTGSRSLSGRTDGAR